MSGAKEQLLEAAINNPKVQSTVAAATIAVSTGTQWIDSLNSILGLVGTVLGCILTTVLIWKNLKDIKTG